MVIKKCGKCAYRRSAWSEKLYEYSMKRIYVRYKNSYRSIGWICPYCKEIKVDKNWKKLLNHKVDKQLYIRWKNTYKKIGKIWWDKKIQLYKNIKIKPKLEYKTVWESF